MVDVLRDRKRRNNVYNLVVFLMSCTDVVASLGFGLSTWPIARDSISHGAMGNETTCEFSQISLLYNLTLSTYFYLTLGREWSERRLRKYRHLMYGLPLGIGLILAFAGIPKYSNVSTWCHIDFPPLWVDSWLPIIFLVAVPSLTVMVVATTLMGGVYLKVRRQTLRMSRWRFRGESAHGTVASSHLQSQEERQRRKELNRNRMDRRVFWQAVLYLSAFYVTNAIWLSLIIHAWFEPNIMDSPVDVYPVFVLHVTLVPLQGLWNSIIYFRPRWIKRRQGRLRNPRTGTGAKPKQQLPKQQLPKQQLCSASSSSNESSKSRKDEVEAEPCSLP